MSKRTQALHALFEPVVQALGCQLWGLEYTAQGKFSVLRVYIDKEEGVDVEDCARVSRQLSSVMDVEDPISGEYTLEVSSPGLDRPLFSVAQFEACIGHRARVQLRQRFENRRNFKGIIRAVEDDEVILVVGDDQYTLPFEWIEKANIISQT